MLEDLQDLDQSADLEAHDHETSDIISDGPTGRKIKNMVVAGRGERLVENARTDVWALGNYAYIGAFNEPCGTGENFESGVADVELVDGVEEPGIAIFDVRNKNKPQYVGNLPSVAGSRTNDVKVAETNSGTILVHSNESCAGGPGGFEIYNVDDPLNPVHLASVRIDDPNPAILEHPVLGPFVTDAGVHNLFLFTQGGRDYVAVVAETWLGNFQIYEITDPTTPALVSVWGAENLCDPDVAACPEDPLTETEPDVLFDLVVNWLLGGFGASANRLLHDITISADGTSAYLSNWDAGLVLLDISDPADPVFVSTALEPLAGSLDGEVNSHAVAQRRRLHRGGDRGGLLRLRQRGAVRRHVRELSGEHHPRCGRQHACRRRVRSETGQRRDRRCGQRDGGVGSAGGQRLRRPGVLREPAALRRHWSGHRRGGVDRAGLRRGNDRERRILPGGRGGHRAVR